MERILYHDIIKSINIYLSEYQKLLFLSSNKYLQGIKNMVTWNTPISIHFAPIIPYSNNFSKIKITCSLIKLQKLVQHLKLKKKNIDNYFGSAKEIIIITPITNELANFLIPSSTIHCKIKNTHIDMSSFPIHTNISHLYFEYRHHHGKNNPINLIKNLSVTHLVIGDNFCFRDGLNVKISKNITHLDVGKNNSALTLALHNSLIYLNLESYARFSCNFIPTALTHLFFDNTCLFRIDQIYPLVTHLKIGTDQANQCLVDLKYFPNVSHLTVGADNSTNYHNLRRIPTLTPTVTYLKCGTICNPLFPIINIYRSNLVHIIFDDIFNLDINSCIPVSCRYLEFGKSFGREISNDILKQVSQIKIYDEYPYLDLLKQEFRGNLIIF